MKSSKLIEALIFAMQVNDMPILVIGKPGIGKSDITEQVKNTLGFNMLTATPIVEDPTDAKGMPWVVNGVADFLPFGNLKMMMEAKSPLIVFIDDFGQANPSMQAAYMQLLLARAINGKKISEHVRFVAASNRREDKAAVGGLLEPVKSRFASILELEVDTDDWVMWALNNNMPVELISFIRFNKKMLDNFEPTKDLKNSPCPRTVAKVGRMLNMGIPDDLRYEMFKGAAGEVFATEFIAYLKVWMGLPSIGQIKLNPDTAPVPDEPGAQYAVSTMCANAMDAGNMAPLYTYLKRLPLEFMVSAVKFGTRLNPSACHTEAFQRFTMENPNAFK
jgi:AAA domain (dynein-related subfamily)